MKCVSCSVTSELITFRFCSKKQIKRCSGALVLAAALVLLTAFNPSLQGQTYTESTIYSFGHGLDGNEPFYSGVVRDAAGNLYGTTIVGGAFEGGTVFKVDPSGKETILHNFFGGSDGEKPYAGLVRDAAGRLYGTTTNGGIQNSSCTSGCGVVFEIDLNGREKILHRFTGTPDGASPVGGLILDSAGNLYGTTEMGGSAGVGTAFKVTASGVETVLYSFGGTPDGAYPQAGVIRDSNGNLYGTTSSSGTGGFGTVFKLNAAGDETILHNFSGGSDGATPLAGLLRTANGNLYGTTFQGGAVYGVGTIFKVDANGTETVLHAFDGSDGEYPESPLSPDSKGNLYGATLQGGPASYLGGVVFKVSPQGAFEALYDFLGQPDGGGPNGPLHLDSSGNIYGTTAAGGTTGNGTVFKLTP
jgi:uncharacterized repeat protein (TIGR03803 family)